MVHRRRENCERYMVKGAFWYHCVTPLQCPASFVNIRKRNLFWSTSSQQLHLIKGESKPLAGHVAYLGVWVE